MNKVWGEIKEKLGKGFVFVDSFDDNGVCIGDINGIEKRQQASGYTRLTKEYELELEGLRLVQKSMAKDLIDARTAFLTGLVPVTEDYLKTYQAIPFRTIHFPIGIDPSGEVIMAETYDPACAKTKIDACRNYITFVKKLISLHVELIEALFPSQANTSTRFEFKGNSKRLKKCYDQLSSKKFIDKDYKSFKAVFSGQASGKINWINKIGTLRYFIDQISIDGRLHLTNKWQLTQEFFLLNRKIIPIESLWRGRYPRAGRIITDLDTAVACLFPPSK